MSHELKEVETGTLLEWYADAASKHGKAMETYDHRTANPQADRAFAIYKELRERGRDAQAQLLTLLKHADPHVRHWAATNGLEFAPEQGETMLLELISSAEGESKIMYQRTLRAWQDGTLKFP